MPVFRLLLLLVHSAGFQATVATGAQCRFSGYCCYWCTVPVFRLLLLLVHSAGFQATVATGTYLVLDLGLLSLLVMVQI